MSNMPARKKFWLSFAASCLLLACIGVALNGWLVAVLAVFVLMALSIQVAFNKAYPAIAGAYGGAVVGLGLALVFMLFGPVAFYG